MRRVLTLLAALSLVVAACGGDADTATDSETDADPGTETTAAGAGGEDTADSTAATSPEESASETTLAPGGGGDGGGECSVTVTGDLEESYVFAQSVFTFTSDHWATEEELRDVIAFLGEENAGGSYEEIVDLGDPIISWFAFNCVDPQDPGKGVLVLPTNETSSDQFPMGSGSYEVTGGLLDAAGPAATVISSFGVDPEQIFGTVPGSGELVITRWDAESLEGTVTFDAVETFVDDNPKEISVTVEFTTNCLSQFHSICR